MTKRKELICRRLDSLSQYFSYKKPEGAFYVFVKILNTADDLTFCNVLLKEANVATVPGSAFGPNGNGYMRLSFGAAEEEINKAFDRIERFLNSQKANRIGSGENAVAVNSRGSCGNTARPLLPCPYGTAGPSADIQEPSRRQPRSVSDKIFT